MTRVVILGAGYAGLGAAMRLGELGVRPILLEASPTVGGHGSVARVAGLPLEHFYHHTKPEDVDLLALVERFGLSDRLRWAETRMGFLCDGRIYPFSSPLDLLRFTPFSMVDRVRFALGVLKAKRADGASLVDRDAKSWIIAEWGRTIYERMMRQMLMNKFGIDPSEISAAFLQGRIKGLSSSKSSYKGGERFAYIDGSTEVLTERLVKAVEGVADLRPGSPVRAIHRNAGGFRIEIPGQTLEADCVINTLPLPAFERIAKNFPFEHRIRYQGAINGIFVVQEKVTPLYWINVLDQDVSFRVLVNHSTLGSYPHTVLYCGNYVAPDSAMYARSSEDLAATYRADLERIFGPLTVLDHAIFRTPVATPIFEKDFGQLMEEVEAQVPGMLFAGNLKIYPGTRTLSSVYRTGVEAADRVSMEASWPKAA
jgi:protoporphyrinogen oxidase